MKIINNTNELTITIPKGVLDLSDIQEFIDLLRYKMLVSKSKASSNEIQEISDEINTNLSKKNEWNLGQSNENSN